MFLLTKDKKIRYDRLLLVFFVLLSVVLAALVITKSTEHAIDTIYVSADGAQMIKIFDMQIEMVDLEDRHISGGMFTVDEDFFSNQTDSNGEIYVPGLQFGKHELYCRVKDDKFFSTNFQITYDYDLKDHCKVDPEDATHFYVPYDLAKLKLQMVYGNNAVRWIPIACYTDTKANFHFPDGTVMDQSGRVFFSDESSLVEGTFTNWNETVFLVGEDTYFNGSGLVIFEDGSFINPGRSVYYKNGHSHMVWGMHYDFGNGFWIDEEGILYFLVEGEDWKLLPDGTIVRPDGTMITDVNALSQIFNLDENNDKQENKPVSKPNKPNTTNKQNTPAKDNHKEENREKEEEETSETKESNIPPKVEEFSGGIWLQASKLHVFTDSCDLAGGAYKDSNGGLVFMPGSSGSYYFRVDTNGNQNVQFSLSLYQGGNLPIPLKFQLTCADGTTSDWFSMSNARNVATALTIDENVKPATNYTNYKLTWWWDDSGIGQDAIDTTLGVQAVNQDVNYEIYALLTISCD